MERVDPKRLRLVETAEKRPLLLVLSHLRWDFVFQRPQHLLTRAAEVFDVVFIEEPIAEGEAFGQRQLQRENGISVVQPLVPAGADANDVLFHQGDVAEAIAEAAGDRPVYLWYYTPMAYAFGHRITADVVIFDKMDELSAFRFAPPQLHVLESLLMDSADVVFTGGASIHRASASRHANIHCFPSSIDAVHFGKARKAQFPDPADQADLPDPRIGYFGVIDERLDIDLVAAVAALRPDWQLVMLGPTAKIDPASLPQAPNIHWLGGKAYADLPAYLAHWDMGFMPFALNDATRFISPTKTPEFLAAGLPLVSTPIHDVVEPYGSQGLVEIAATAAGIVAAGDRLLTRRADIAAEKRRQVAADAFLSGGSWDRTWAAMLAEIRSCDLVNRARRLRGTGSAAKAAVGSSAVTVVASVARQANV